MRLKITGYIETEDLDPDQVDEGHSTGLSESGYLDLVHRLSDLDDVDIEKA